MLETILPAAVGDVLEKMFFLGAVEQPLECAPPETGMTVRVAFEGDPSGWLELAVSPGVERSIAADFLGEYEVGEQAARDVMCELANMICGSALSRLDTSSEVRLGSPRVVEHAAQAEHSASYSAAVGSGALRVTLHTERPLCPVNDQRAS